VRGQSVRERYTVCVAATRVGDGQGEPDRSADVHLSRIRRLDDVDRRRRDAGGSGRLAGAVVAGADLTGVVDHTAALGADATGGCRGRRDDVHRERRLRLGGVVRNRDTIGAATLQDARVDRTGAIPAVTLFGDRPVETGLDRQRVRQLHTVGVTRAGVEDG